METTGGQMGGEPPFFVFTVTHPHTSGTVITDTRLNTHLGSC